MLIPTHLKKKKQLVMLTFQDSVDSMCKGLNPAKLPQREIEKPIGLPKQPMSHFHQPQCC